MRRDLVVLGASAGGIEALRALMGGLPRDFPASLAVVVHSAPDSPGVLAGILERAGSLRAVTVRGPVRLEPGTVYVPAADHHLMVEPSRALATRGPRENRFRPAIDPLFRSAAQAYGPRVIGVILTGGLDDGAAGLWTVKRLGGVAVVQEPRDALYDAMPLNALAATDADHCVPLAQLAPLLVRLASEDIAEIGGYTVPEKVKIEVDIARERPALEAGVARLGEPSPYACPECHGVLLQVEDGELTRYRCHTGHAYSSDSLLADFDEAIGTALETSVRALQEKAIFVRHLAGHERDRGGLERARTFERLADDAQQRSEALRRAAMDHAGAREETLQATRPVRGNGSDEKERA